MIKDLRDLLDNRGFSTAEEWGRAMDKHGMVTVLFLGDSVTDDVWWYDLGNPVLHTRSAPCHCCVVHDATGTELLLQPPVKLCPECGGRGEERKAVDTGLIYAMPEKCCTGIKLCTSVEGSEVELDRVLVFPFEPLALDEALSDLDRESSYYWERDNSLWYEVRVWPDGWPDNDKYESYQVQLLEDEITWCNGAPENASAEALVVRTLRDNPFLEGLTEDRLFVGPGWYLAGHTEGRGRPGPPLYIKKIEPDWTY